MKKLIFISLFLLVASAPVGKADATAFLSPLSDRLGTLDHLSSFPDVSLPNEGAPRTPGTIKGSVPVHGSDEADLKLLAQTSSMSGSGTASKSAGTGVDQGLGAQAKSPGKTTTSGDICELTDEGIVCNENSESQVSRNSTGSGQDGMDDQTQQDPKAAFDKLKGIVDIFSQ